MNAHTTTGSAGPRIIGWARTHSEVDTLAIAQRLSARFVSRAQVKLLNGEQSDPFFIIHGV
jgi:hypothetical protein